MTLYEEIGTALKMKRKGDESFEDFGVRFAKKANGLPEAEWGELTEELQFFCNGVLQAREAQQEVKTELSYTDSAGEVHEVKFTGWPADDAETADEASDDGEDGGEEASDEATEETSGEESVDSGDDSGQEDTSEEAEQPASRKKAEKKPKPAKKAVKAPAKKAEPEPKPPKTAKTTTKPTGKAKAMATPKTAKKETSGERAARITDDNKIKLVTKENPHRSGTKLFNMFKKYKDGMTVAQAKKAGLPVSNIAYLKGLGHLKVTAA